MDRFCQPHSPYPILAARPAGGRFRPKSRPNPAFAGYNSEKAQYSDTPVLQHSARQDSRTRTRTNAERRTPNAKRLVRASEFESARRLSSMHIYLKLANTSAKCSAFIFEPERFNNPSRCMRQLESFEIR